MISSKFVAITSFLFVFLNVGFLNLCIPRYHRSLLRRKTYQNAGKESFCAMLSRFHLVIPQHHRNIISKLDVSQLLCSYHLIFKGIVKPLLVICYIQCPTPRNLLLFPPVFQNYPGPMNAKKKGEEKKIIKLWSWNLKQWKSGSSKVNVLIAVLTWPCCKYIRLFFEGI